jgi:hypothetical protein
MKNYNIKLTLDDMMNTISSAPLYRYEPKPPTEKSLAIRKLIEYAKITEFKK